MPANAEETQAQLIRAAERLFAEKGVDAVSLREVNREAGQRNATALQYHFKNRQGLLQAILRKHDPAVDEHRNRLLDQIEREASAELTQFSAALVLPAAAKLADRDGGRAYLRIGAQLVNSYRPRVDPVERVPTSQSMNRWREMVAPQMLPLAVSPLHSRFTAARITLIELARRAENRKRRDDRLFTSHLIDLVAALLGAPVSKQTESLIREREAR